MNISQLKSTAADSLSRAAYCPRRLILLHTGAALGASVLLTVLNFILSRSLGAATGLAAIDKRTMLVTAQSVLSLLLTLALPFWELGFTRASLLLARQEAATPKTLLEGFRRFGPALRLMLLRGLFVGMLGFFCLQIASVLYVFSPFGQGLMTQMEQLLESDLLATSDPAALEALLPSLMPMYILAGVLLIGLLIPLFYRFRLADLAIMDDRTGALAALQLSAKAMKGKALPFFKLDLSFWWYYLLMALAAAVAYGDVALSWLNVPINADVSYFLFYGLSIFLQLFIAWRFTATVQTTYATAYLTLREMQNEE